MLQISSGLNRHFSYLQQVLLSDEQTDSPFLFTEEIMETLNVVAIIVAGLMVGSELAIAAFVHPTLDRLPDNVHLSAAGALARVLGKVMPFWYLIVLLLTSAEALIEWRLSGRIATWFSASAFLWILTILYTVSALVPVNNQIASWENLTPPPDWKTHRRKWDLRHRWRVLLLILAFTLLIVGFLPK